MKALTIAVAVCACAVLTSAQFVQPNLPNAQPNLPNVEPNMPVNNVDDMDLHEVMNNYNPKLVVIHNQNGVNEKMPSGVHSALVKSLMSDFHSADVPVIYAEKRDIPMH